MGNEPILHKRPISDIREQVREQLAGQDLRVQPGGAGQAMIQLFGHYVEVIINRLNRVPDQHFRAFLNAAEVEPLPPRAAQTELTFEPVPDGQTAIRVPAGTQAATRPSAEQPEVVFETERTITVVPTELTKCVSVDRVRASERTAQAAGMIDETYAAFVGETERERVLYIGHDTLLSFPDEASRQGATIVLDFTFAQTADPAMDGGWQLVWSFWNGEKWHDLVEAGATVEDRTNGFQQDGEVKFRHLPEIIARELDSEESTWMACRLTGGSDRLFLPQVQTIQVFREIWIPPRKVTGGAAAVRVERAPAIPAAPNTQLRRLYFGHDQLFTFDDDESRDHARVTLVLIPQVGDEDATSSQRSVNWLYWDGLAWLDLSDVGTTVVDETAQFTEAGTIRFSALPVMAPTEIDGLTQIWIAAEFQPDDETAQDPVFAHADLVVEILGQATPIDEGLAAVQAGTVYSPLELEGPMMPLGPQPGLLDSFYLRVDEAFTKPGATVTFEMNLAGLADTIEDTSELDALRIEWEYFGRENPDRSGWLPLGISQRGCPDLQQLRYEFPDLPAPVLRTKFFTRRRVLDITLPEDIDEGQMRLMAKYGSVITDIYTGEKYVEIPVPDSCKNLPEEILLAGCSTPIRKGFRDNSCALTVRGRTSITFTVPDAEDPSPFVETDVDGRVGYWVRARVAAGSYDVPQKIRRGLIQRLFGSTPVLPPIAHPPVIEKIGVNYANFLERQSLQSIEQCRSRTDHVFRDHAIALRTQEPFWPFTARVEEHALYMGFNPMEGAVEPSAFPSGKWLQLRFDVEELEEESQGRVFWEYWNGRQWLEVRAADDTLSLRRRGYLGFFVPTDIESSEEFGVRAFWLRVRPEQMPNRDDGESKPVLGTILLNTVPAINAKTVNDELLGDSTGESNQRFALSRPPILPDIRLEVREPEAQRGRGSDIVMVDEATTEGQQDARVSSSAFGGLEYPVHEQWVTWDATQSFLNCGPDSRCYRLDPVTGMVEFGDGRHGRIPPPGRNNIRAKVYRTHSAAAGNLGSGAISVLRTPSAELSDIRSVTNLEYSLGGGAPETVVETKTRGPHTLKHRSRSVTQEDYQWITVESEEIALAYCLPLRDRQGQYHPGWVTLVVVPQSTDAKPLPSPALLRRVRSRLESSSLANLKRFDFVETSGSPSNEITDQDQIHVVNPRYLEIAVSANVVCKQPEEADEVKVQILERLDRYFHPLTGGPGASGWRPGRDVYISEVAAEIEEIAGVDYVLSLDLTTPAMQQRTLVFTDALESCCDLPAGSLVSTFDQRVKMVLARPWHKGGSKESAVVLGLNTDEIVDLVAADGTMVAENLSIAALHKDAIEIEFAQPVVLPTDEIEADGLLYLQGTRVRLVVERLLFEKDEKGQSTLRRVVVQWPMQGDFVSVVHPIKPRCRVDFVQIQGTKPITTLSRVYVPDDHLVASYGHKVEMELEVDYADSAS